MKLKKYIGVFASICALAMFAGCYEPLEITDSEMDMVAEYAAGVLVKHGTQATDILLDRDEQEEAFAALATPTPRPTLAPVEEDNTAPETGENNETDGAQENEKPKEEDVADNSELTMQDLSELMGKGEFFFRYKDYKATALYQGSGDLFAAAGDGKQLVVVEFEVTNQSQSGATLTLNKGASKEFIYTLRTGGKTIRPSLTLLNEDIYTSYNATYKAGETKTCVLVFECDAKLSLSSMTLTVLRDVNGREDSVLLKIK